MNGESSEDSYSAGLRDGKLSSLESSVHELTQDVKSLKAAMWMLYGAIGLLGLIPRLWELVERAN